MLTSTSRPDPAVRPTAHLRRCERTVDGLMDGMAALKQEIARLERENASLADDLARQKALATDTGLPSRTGRRSAAGRR